MRTDKIQTLKAIIIRIRDFLMRPIKENLLFMLFLFAALCPYLLMQFQVLGYTFNGILLAVHNTLLAYLATLLVGLIKPKIVKKFVQAALVLAMAVLFAWNFYCIFEFKGLLDEDYFMLILNTNASEASEFMTGVVSTSVLMGVSTVFLVFIALWLILRRHPLRISNRFSVPFLALLLMLVAVHVRYWQIWLDGPVNHIAYLLSAIPKYDVPDESQLNSANPSIEFVAEQDMPANVILIIGESFSRNHSSMYGYDKPTNPLLGALRNSSMLFTFDSIDAPDVQTVQALKFMLTLYGKADTINEDKMWYEYANLMELMRVSGYDNYWYSNQSRNGKFNYAARVFARACDHVHFYQQEGPSHLNTVLDQVLVDSSYQDSRQFNKGRHFVVYHMMGSHFEYSMRYPEEFNRFSKNDYIDHIIGQREILASFDNSILYNDFIVEQIIRMYHDKETIIVYVPDHGQDMFDSSPDYFMHGKRNDPVSWAYGVKIPFMVYASPLFQKKYPEVMARIKNRQEHPKAWNTDDLPYFIMDLIGVTAINGEPVAPKSIL